MKRTVILFTLLVFAFQFISGQTSYQRISINIERSELPALFRLGIPADDGYLSNGNTFIIELSEQDVQKVQAAGFGYQVLIDDMTTYYRERSEETISEILGREFSGSREWTVPEGFSLGSVGGYSSIDEMLGHLDDMVTDYPDLISQVQTFDQLTHEGRQLRWVRISDNPNINEEGEPEVLYTGMHHAREPIGMQHLLFFMYYLLENYDTDPDIQYIIDNFELYFVPVVNMDGYAYNIQIAPGGGGLWRKNRRDNGDGTYGVDLNRNYGYLWGLDNYGSSPNTGDETYRGPSAFSEPETQILKGFCEEHDFVTALNYHSYGNLLLYPWGYTSDPTPDVDIFEVHSELMVEESGYANQPGVQLYPTNGSSDDWMYGEQGTKDLILSYTPEVGNSNDGFWPASSRIIPLCQENMWQSMMAAKLSGAYATAEDINPSIIDELQGELSVRVQRIGMLDGADYTVSITPVNDAISSIGDPVVFSGLYMLQIDVADFAYTLREDIQAGDEILYLVSIDNGMMVTSDTVSKVYGEPAIIFVDEAENFEHWVSSKWNITTDYYHSENHSITDSPYGNYNNYENNSMTLGEPIDLTDAIYAVLNFWARWEIESGYDYVQVFASGDNGQTWNPLEGNHTHPGNSNQAEDEPLYDGFQQEWINEEILLDEFLGQEILLRFTLKSDSWVTEDGFYWDDLTVTIVDVATSMVDHHDVSGSLKVFPNPVSDILTIMAGSEGILRIYDPAGREVESRDLSDAPYKLNLDTHLWMPGIYFYRFIAANGQQQTGKLVKHR